MPEFKLSVGKDTLSNESFKGSVYVLEVAGLTADTFQDQFVELNSIVPLYSQRNVRWLTIPLDPQTTIDAFVDSKKPNWKFANAHNFENNKHTLCYIVVTSTSDQTPKLKNTKQ